MDNLMINHNHIISKDFLDLNKSAQKEKVNYLLQLEFGKLGGTFHQKSILKNSNQMH